jgi:hypothetical protein
MKKNGSSNQAKKQKNASKHADLRCMVSDSVRKSNINFLVVVNLNLLYTVGKHVDLGL